MYKLEDSNSCKHCNKEIKSGFFCIYDGVVYETEAEWKAYHRAHRAEFLGRMGGRSNIQISSMQPFQSPIDGKMITNNADLSAHNREHGVYQLGDDQKRKRDVTAELKREEMRDTNGE